MTCFGKKQNRVSNKSKKDNYDPDSQPRIYSTHYRDIYQDKYKKPNKVKPNITVISTKNNNSSTIEWYERY